MIYVNIKTQYKTHAYLLPLSREPPTVADVFLFNLYTQIDDYRIERHFVISNDEEVELKLHEIPRKLRKKKRKMWITELTPSAIEYLNNLKERLKRINKTYKSFLSRGIKKKHLIESGDYSPEEFVPILEGYPLSEVSEEQREAYLKQEERVSYYVWRGDEL